MSKVGMDVDDDKMMLALHVGSWCTPGTVPERINFSKIMAPTEPKKNEVVVSFQKFLSMIFFLSMISFQDPTSKLTS